MADHLRENIDYECLRSFSSGAFGKVHSGYLFSTGEAVVIKKGKKKDLKGEYDLLKQLSAIGVGKTHVVRVFGYSDHPPEFSIIMERAQCSLDQLLHRAPFQTGLPPMDIIQLVADLGTVLKFLLDKNVAHRDIKPQNILVFSGANDPAKSQFMFKLCDFGAARETAGEGDPCHTIVGTVPYLNPEILLELRQHPQLHRTKAPYTAEKCDLWSLGVTLYNASTGSLPWPSVGGEMEVRALHENRRGAICALPLADGSGYRYYDTIRAESYPRWLRNALSSLIRSQFTSASYSTFLSQCAYIAGVGGAGEMPEGAKGCQKRLVLLPSLTPSVHVEVDDGIFPGAHIQLSALFGLPIHTRTTCLTADGVIVFGPGQPISLNNISDEAILVWNELSQGFGADNAKIMPTFASSSREGEHQRCVQRCYDLDRQCDEIIEAHRVATHITKRNVDRVMARVLEHKQWLHSIERNEKHAASTAAVAAIMQSRNKDMLDQLSTCPVETAKRKKDVERCAEEAKKLSECVAKWTHLDERHIANWQDSLRRLSARPITETTSRSAFEMDEKWAKTMKKRVEDRLKELKEDCEYRVKKAEGIAHVIRNVVSLDAILSECVRKMKETASLVSTIADQARDSVTKYMQNTAGMDEAVIRRNLTNSVSAVSMLRRNVEKQAELVKKMEELRVSFQAHKGNAEHSNGKANGIVQPTVINVNQTLTSLDEQTITPAKSSFQ